MWRTFLWAQGWFQDKRFPSSFSFSQAMSVILQETPSNSFWSEKKKKKQYRKINGPKGLDPVPSKVQPELFCVFLSLDLAIYLVFWRITVCLPLAPSPSIFFLFATICAAKASLWQILASCFQEKWNLSRNFHRQRSGQGRAPLPNVKLEPFMKQKAWEYTATCVAPGAWDQINLSWF